MSTNETPFEWRFRKLRRDEMRQDATEAEFFKQDEDLPDAVVRELIQNSLDALAPDAQQVVVCFSFSGEKFAVPPFRTNRWFNSLQRYFEFAENRPHGFFSEPLPYLVVEDSGTKGLQGDPAQDWDTAEKNDFYMFWRNVGRSSKQEGKRGRWGLGKAVNHEASKASAFFGITHRLDDGNLLLMGRSVLPFQVKKGEAYDPRGWFGWPDEDEERGTLMMPVSNATVIDEFCSDFHLERKSTPGLSLVIPMPKEELTTDSVIEATVRHYFHAILTHKLQVRVGVMGKKQTIIDASTIETIAKTFVGKEGSSLAKLFDLAKWGCELPDEDRILLGEVGRTPPDWNSDVFSTIADRRNELHASFQAGNPLAFRLPILVQRIGSTPVQNSTADVYLERLGSVSSTVEEERGRTVFVREGMTVPMPRLSHERSVRALLIVDSRPLSALLGDAENPMHTDWIKSSDKLTKRNKNGPQTVAYIKRAIREITRWLAQLEDQKREDLLADIFHVEEHAPNDAGKNEEPIQKKKKKGRPTKKLPTGKKNLPIFEIKKFSSGFEITGTDELIPPQALSIRAAYDARDRNPFEAYRPHDFVIGDGSIEVFAKGAEYSIDSNRIHIKIRRKDFKVTVTGFDARRDLRVDGRKETGDDE